MFAHHHCLHLRKFCPHKPHQGRSHKDKSNRRALRFRAFETAWLVYKISETQDTVTRESYGIELNYEIDKYEKIINDLMKGNKELNLKPIEYEEPLQIIRDITEEWNRYLKPALLQIYNNDRNTGTSIATIDSRIHEHVYKIDRVASYLEKDYIKELREYDLYRLYVIGIFFLISIFIVFF